MKKIFSVFNLTKIANWLLLIGFLVSLIGITLFIWKQKLFNTGQIIDTSAFGNLGSFLSGTVGSMWSLASVLYFILALKEQRKDIANNQNAQSVQRFEGTFFQLLNLHSNTVNELTFNNDEKKLIGKKIFDYWKLYLDQIANADNRTVTDLGNGTIRELRNRPFNDQKQYLEYLHNNYYTEYYFKFESSLNHYFRQLYHLFKYIHESKLDSTERHFYASLVRAQLSQNELYAIAVNSVMPEYGYPKFMNLIKQYNILKNFNHSVIPGTILWECITQVMSNTNQPLESHSQT